MNEIKTTETVWCDAHENGAHIETPDCRNPHGTRNHVETEVDEPIEYTEVDEVKPESDGGWMITFDDRSQIDATSQDVSGVTFGAGKLDGSGWGQMNLSWTALQAVADELNAQLRQARVNGWL